jgi:uncharacterized delta-60 repeat protein
LEQRTLLSAGDLDPTFGLGGTVTIDLPGSADDYPTQVALQADGKLLEVARHNGFFVPESTVAVTRFNADGTLDTSFGNNGLVFADFPGRGERYGTIDLAPDGRIVVCASSAFPLTDLSGADQDVSVAVFNPDGSFDTSFDGDGMTVFDVGQALGGAAAPKTTDFVTDAAVQSDGKVVIAVFLVVNNQNRFVVSRLNPDGTLDAGFGTGGIASASLGDHSGGMSAVTVDDQGRIVVAGTTGIPGADGRVADPDFTVARFTPEGVLDATFNGNGYVVIPFGTTTETLTAIETAPGGKIVVAGSTDLPGFPTGDIAVARLNDDGSLDASFDGDGKAQIGLTIHNKQGDTVASGDYAKGLAVQPDGAILLSGFNATGRGNIDYVTEAFVVRLDSGGAPDTSFGDGGKVVVSPGVRSGSDVAVRPDDGSIFIGGYRDDSNANLDDFAAEHFDSAGRLDTSYGAGGTASADFPAPGFESAVAGAVDGQGRIIAGGFWYYGSDVKRDMLFARYNPDGTLDPTFGTGGLVRIDLGERSKHAESVTALAVDALGRVVFTGMVLDPASGAQKIMVGRLRVDGTLDTSFSSGTGVFIASAFDGNADSKDAARDILIDPAGRIVVAGEYAPTAARPEFAVLRLDADGNPDATFGPGGAGMIHMAVTGPTGSDSTANAVALAPDQDGDGSDLVVAGRSHGLLALVRLNDDGQLDPLFGGGTGKVTGKINDNIGVPNDVAIDSAGYIVTGGSLSVTGQGNNFSLARFSPVGVLDPTFGTGGKVTTDFALRDDLLNSLVVLPDRSIVAGGVASIPPAASITLNANDFAVARYTAAGVLDPSFGSGGKVTTNFTTGSYPGGLNAGQDVASRLLAYPGGRVVAVGTAFTPDTGSDFALARYMLADPPPPPAHVQQRALVYNRSAYDGNDPAITADELLAVAPDKSALLPAEAVSFANVSSYSRGINGLAVRFDRELDRLTAGDFVFRVGSGAPGGEWSPGPAPTAFDLAPRAAAPGTFALFTWADGAIKNQWLEVTILANERTRLANPDVFSFGNLIGETGDGAGTQKVNALDLGAVKRALNSTSGVTGRYDFNRDGRVNALDLGTVKANLNRSLTMATEIAAVAAAEPGAAGNALSVERVWDESPSGLLE